MEIFSRIGMYVFMHTLYIYIYTQVHIKIEIFN